ncbi:hypothetical protein ACIBAI_01070 [Streptomyces sp. NPDC051041]|uniref:hypothetical protein n=1 Tax=Streptomyces sp. NPDC051041 TaxID=3365640 RepID=UPI00379AEB51
MPPAPAGTPSAPCRAAWKGRPEAERYGLDRVCGAFDLGCRGPKSSRPTMPDPYAPEAFRRLMHGGERDKPPVAGWDEPGDGSVLDAVREAGEEPADVIADTAGSRRAYGRCVRYSLTGLVRWLERCGAGGTVPVLLGDRRPVARAGGNRASRDVPVPVVAGDPEAPDRIAGRGWAEGVRSAKDAPGGRTSAFGGRFPAAYGSAPHLSGPTGPRGVRLRAAGQPPDVSSSASSPTPAQS